VVDLAQKRTVGDATVHKNSFFCCLSAWDDDLRVMKIPCFTLSLSRAHYEIELSNVTSQHLSHSHLSLYVLKYFLQEATMEKKMKPPLPSNPGSHPPAGSLEYSALWINRTVVGRQSAVQRKQEWILKRRALGADDDDDGVLANIS
jgi:hypothetical protein